MMNTTTSPDSGISRYYEAIRQLQQQVINEQVDLLQQVAAAMTQTIVDDGRIFLFGTGHSHLLAEEGHYRAGGLAPVVPILASNLMLHDNALLSGVLERTPGLAESILARYRPRPGEMLFVFSNSGVNQLPVEMALLARNRKLVTVSISSFSYAQVAPLSAAQQRLDQIVDYALDNGGQPGDSLLPVPGSAWSTGPSSTLIGTLIWHCLVSEVAQQLAQQQIDPPIFASANLPGAAEHNQALLDRWRPRNPHL